MTELVRGFRGKLGDSLDTSRPFTVKMRTTGSAVYDTCCFGVDAADKLSDDRYMVFYNQTASPAGEIRFADNAGVSEYTIELEKLPPSIAKLVFTVSIDGEGTMGQIQSHTIGLWQDGEEKMRLTLGGSDFASEKAIIGLEMYLKTVWRVAVVASGFNGGLDALLTSYGGELSDEPAQAAPAPAPTPAASTPSFTTSTPSPAASTPSFTTSTPSPAPSTPSFTTSTPSPAASTPSFTTSTPSPAPSTPSFTTSTPSPAASTPSFTTSTPQQSYGVPQQTSTAQMSQPQQGFGVPRQTSTAQMSQRSGVSEMQPIGQPQAAAPAVVPSGYDVRPLPEIPPMYHQTAEYSTMTVNEALMNISAAVQPASYDTRPLPDMPAYGHAAAFDYDTVPLM